MQDRPTYDELLGAVERFLDEEIVPNVPGSRGFHARVAANAIRTVRRELDLGEAHLGREWEGLNGILGEEEMPPALAEMRAALRARNEALCEMVRTEEVTPDVVAHIRRTVEDKLRVTNPDLLARAGGLLDQKLSTS
jgi:hypothetical protein